MQQAKSTFRFNEGYGPDGVSIQNLFAGTGSGFGRLLDLWLVSYIVDWGWLHDLILEVVSVQSAAATNSQSIASIGVVKAGSSSNATASLSQLPRLTCCVNWVPETGNSEEPLPDPFRDGHRTLNRVPGCHCEASCSWGILHPHLGEDDKALMHAKLFLLGYEGGVRLVVSSANLTLDDWVGLGQSVWWCDCPRLPPRTLSERTTLAGGGRRHPLAEDVLRVLQTVGLDSTVLPPEVIDAVCWDGLNERLVFSVPTSLMQVVGVDRDVAGRMNALEHLAMLARYAVVNSSEVAEATGSDVAVYFASSVGGTLDDQLSLLCRAWNVTPSRLVVPVLTVETLQQQLHHSVGAITTRYFQSPSSKLFRECITPFLENTTASFHCKILIHFSAKKMACSEATAFRENDSGSLESDWALIGSHNLTADGWVSAKVARERVAMNKDSSSDPRNYELSVFIPGAKLRVLPHLPPSMTQFLARIFSPASSGEGVASSAGPLHLPKVPNVGPKRLFRFFNDKSLILQDLRMTHIPTLEECSGEPTPQTTYLRRRWYHWLKFLSEFGNDFGRH